MTRKPISNLLAVTLAVLALVAAEAVSLAHALDVDAHSGGEPCKICISVAGVGTGVPAKSPPPEAPRVDIPGSASPILSVDLSRIEQRCARGPPHVS